MNNPSTQLSDTLPEARESWVPMIAIALGQAIMSFNVASLPVSLAGMVNSFGVPPTTVATGIVMYSLAVAGFVMLGAKLVQRFGSTQVFRIVVALFGVSQVLMVVSPVATVMLLAQLLAGLSAAVIVPALVALIANHYHGQQQATAVGALGSAWAGAGVAAEAPARGVRARPSAADRKLSPGTLRSVFNCSSRVSASARGIGPSAIATQLSPAGNVTTSGNCVAQPWAAAWAASAPRLASMRITTSSAHAPGAAPTSGSAAPKTKAKRRIRVPLIDPAPPSA